jgi:hypothetical protein
VLQRKSFTSAAGGNVVTMASGLGGLLYITIAWGNTFGPLDATITGAMQVSDRAQHSGGLTEGACLLHQLHHPTALRRTAPHRCHLQAPFFFKGKTTEAEWRVTLRTSPVPFAELGSDKCVADSQSALCG